MKILIWSVHPKVASGYGMGTLAILNLLTKTNHELYIQSSYGNYSYIDEITVNDKIIKIYPAKASNSYGSDAIIDTIEVVKPDIILQFFDLFAAQNLKKITDIVPVYSMLMVDSSPYMFINDANLQLIHPIVVTKWAEGQLKKELIKYPVKYCPIPISTQYKFATKYNSRNLFTKVFTDGKEVVTDEDKLISVVSANSGDPGRKNLCEIIRAFKTLSDNNKNLYMYMHTDVAVKGSIDIRQQLKACNYSEHNFEHFLFPSPKKYQRSEYGIQDLRHLYSLSDIYLNAAQGGGFEMPVAEAMSCGCTPLVTNFGALKELITDCIPDPTRHLLNGQLVEVGCSARRLYVQADEIIAKAQSLLDTPMSESDKELMAVNAQDRYQSETKVTELLLNAIDAK